MINKTKVKASLKVVQPRPLIMFSQTPIRNAPITAPGMEPIPPNTAAVNALIPGIDPKVGDKDGYVEHKSIDAIAARPEPIAKVIEIVEFTLIPIN